MKENNMKLFIINEVLSDYTAGMVVIAAVSLERARELFEDQFYQLDEFDASVSKGAYKVLEVVNQPEGVVSYVYGGG